MAQGTAASVEEVTSQLGSRFGSPAALVYHRTDEPRPRPEVQAAAVERLRSRIADICSWDPGFDLDIEEMLRRP